MSKSKPAATLTAAPQIKSGSPLTQVRLFKGLPYGSKLKFWSAVCNNLNSAQWSSIFPAPAVAANVTDNWTRMLTARAAQQSVLAKKQAGKAGNPRACAGANEGEFESGAGDRDPGLLGAANADVDEMGGEEGGVTGSKAKQDKIDSLLDSYLAQAQAFHGTAAAVAHSTPAAKKSGQAGEDVDEVECAALGGTMKRGRKDSLPGPTSVERAQEHAMQQSSQFASGFASIAESFKGDTAEVFAGKAKAIATHIGTVSDQIQCVVCA
jgi:hypothetical protein